MGCYFSSKWIIFSTNTISINHQRLDTNVSHTSSSRKFLISSSSMSKEYGIHYKVNNKTKTYIAYMKHCVALSV